MNLVTYERHESVGVITLSRPEAHNAFDLQMAADLLSAVDQATEDRAARSLLLRSTGRLFSAGGDVGAFARAGRDVGRLIAEVAELAHPAIYRLMKASKPVVAAVQGPVAGLGLGLALACDEVLAASSASFVAGYASLGLSPDGGVSSLLPRLVGLRRAQSFLFSDIRLTAEQALDWGLISSVLPDEELASAAQARAERLATGPTEAFGRIKALLGSTASLSETLANEARSIATLAATSDGQEGIKAFSGRRQPRFTGTDDRTRAAGKRE